VTRILVHRWLPLTVATTTALALWGLAAVHGYGWAMIWLPAAVAGAAWPKQGKRSFDDCRSWGRERRGRG
jgi:hypothetical protein